MAELKISDYIDVDSIDGTELILVSKDGSYRKTTIEEIRNLANDIENTALADLLNKAASAHDVKNILNAINNNFENLNSQLSDIACNVKTLGAKGDGVTDDTEIIQYALTNYKTVYIPEGNYKITKGLTTRTDKFAIVGTKNTKLNFSIPNNTENGITINSLNRWSIKDLEIRMNETGLNAIEIQSGDNPTLKDIYVFNSYLNAINLNINTDYAWLEGLSMIKVCGSVNGYNFINMYVGDKIGTFITESIFRQCEARGVSTLHSDGCAIIATCGNNEISAMHLIDCNFDAQRGTANANGHDTGAHPIYLKHFDTTNTNSNKFFGWTIIGGGWETTTANPDWRETGLVYAETGIVTKGWFFTGVSNGGWSGGYELVNINGLINDLGNDKITLPGVKNPVTFDALVTFKSQITTPNFVRSNVSGALPTNGTGTIYIPCDLGDLSLLLYKNIFRKSIVNLRQCYMRIFL